MTLEIVRSLRKAHTLYLGLQPLRQSDTKTSQVFHINGFPDPHRVNQRTIQIKNNRINIPHHFPFYRITHPVSHPHPYVPDAFYQIPSFCRRRISSVVSFLYSPGPSLSSRLMPPKEILSKSNTSLPTACSILFT